MSDVRIIGLDIAKSVFQLHGVDGDGAIVLQKRLTRARLLPFFEKLPPCLIGIEACATSHFWARELTRLGHEVKLMPAQYVKPYVKRQKNDMAERGSDCRGRNPAEHPFVYEARILPRAQVSGAINTARENIVVDCAATSLQPRQEARPNVSSQLELHWPSGLLLNDHRARLISAPETRSAILILTMSHPRSLLSIARSNRARSRSRPSRSRKNRTAHICFCVSGRLVPTILPAFHAGRECMAGSYLE